jgi:hypothetical protein
MSSAIRLRGNVSKGERIRLDIPSGTKSVANELDLIRDIERAGSTEEQYCRLRIRLSRYAYTHAAGKRSLPHSFDQQVVFGIRWPPG